MVVIRLTRGGTKKRPFYHIIVADKRSKRDGRFIERIGYFNPIASGQDQRLKFDDVRIQYWVSQGAQMSERVASLVQNAAVTAIAA